MGFSTKKITAETYVVTSVRKQD